MNVLVASVQSPYTSGGAEQLAAALVDHLRLEGHRAELMRLPFFPRPVEQVVASMQAARTIEIGETNFGPIDRVITLKFPAYLIDHPDKTLWLVHQYRQFGDLWNEPGIGFAALPVAASLRPAVTRADRLYLPRHRRVFAISIEVARRLRESCDLEAETLYPPVAAAGYFCDQAEDYLLFPSRLSKLKRQSLALAALAMTRAPVRLQLVGPADEAAAIEEHETLARTLGIADRVDYLGSVSDGDLQRLFARAIAVVFPPRLEDLGLVAQQAMLSSKPVITCTDSGGVLEFVTDKDNGVVTEPSPEALAEAFDRLWADRATAARLGRCGRERLDGMKLSWPHVIQRLLGAA